MDDDLLRDLFTSIGTIQIRRMFGGKGIYADGMIVAVVVGGELMLKADAATAADFEAAGCLAWTYPRAGKAPVRMPYFRLPDEAYDDPSIMAEWAGLALAAARRSVGDKKPATTSRIRRKDP